MFRQRQKISFMPSSCSSLPATSYDEDGNSKDSFITGHEVLPDVENFKIKNLLKAGVPLEQVNTKVIDSGSVDLSNFSKPAKKPADKPAEKSVEKPAESVTNSTQVKE